MEATVNNITIEDVLWIRLGDSSISFRPAGMDRRLHFTLSYHPDSEYVNLHITKDCEDPVDKPKIEVARIKKSELALLQEDIRCAFLTALLRPIRLKSFRGSRRARGLVHYFSFSHIAPNGSTAVGDTLTKKVISAWPYRRKGRKLRIGSPLGNIQRAFSKDPELLKVLNNALVELPDKISGKVEGGIVLSRKFAGAVISMNNQWFAIRQDFNFWDAIGSLLEDGLQKALADRLFFAIENTLLARSLADTDVYREDAITLYVKGNDPDVLEA